MTQPTSQRIMETVWPWKARAAATAPASGRPNAVRGGVQALVMAILGLVLYFYLNHRVMAFAVWFFSVVVAASALFIPPVFAVIDGFGRRLGLWVGIGLTYLLLVPFFYLVFVPGRLVLWLLRRDPMNRGFPAPESSCWVPRSSKMDDRHYRKQFS